MYFLDFLMQLTFFFKFWKISYFTCNYFKVSPYTCMQEPVDRFSLQSSCRASCPLPADGGPLPRPPVRPSAGVFRLGRGAPDRVGDLEEHERNLLRRSGETDRIWNRREQASSRSLTDLRVFAFTVQEDMQRMFIWEGNKHQIEENNRGFLMGSKHFTMAMNKYGDLVRTKV